MQSEGVSTSFLRRLHVKLRRSVRDIERICHSMPLFQDTRPLCVLATANATYHLLDAMTMVESIDGLYL